ncbi:hypothetical protein QTP88_005760 [Uroleucon formosanum]
MDRGPRDLCARILRINSWLPPDRPAVRCSFPAFLVLSTPRVRVSPPANRPRVQRTSEKLSFQKCIILYMVAKQHAARRQNKTENYYNTLKQQQQQQQQQQQ